MYITSTKKNRKKQKNKAKQSAKKKKKKKTSIKMEIRSHCMQTSFIFLSHIFHLARQLPKLKHTYHEYGWAVHTVFNRQHEFFHNAAN